MTKREDICKACDGSGMLADDEGWQYNCSVCHGEGEIERNDEPLSAQIKVMEVDANNRLLD